MIVYRDQTAEVTFQHSFPGPVTATVYIGGSVVGNPERFVTTVNDGSVNFHTVTLDSNDTQFDGEITIVWRATGFERKTQVTVVTPIVPFTRLAAAFPERNSDDEEFFNELESSIRLIIEAYTGTKFEYFKGVVSVNATNNSIVLPVRAIDIYDVPGLSAYKISPNRKILIPYNDQYLTIKQSPPDDLVFMTHGVITVPSYYRRVRQGSMYDVYGEFGYIEVPEDVQEAAMLLANDYLCNDGIYKDRYITTVKTELTNYIYDPRAFSGTGNSRVDLLLSKYKAEGYAWL